VSALGHKQTYAVQNGMSALPPIATLIAFFSMSALPPKADMCGATAYVCFGPIADMVRLLDQLVSALLQKQWHVQAKLLRRLKIDGHHEFRR